MPSRVVKNGGVDGICGVDERFLMGKRVVFKDVDEREEKGLVTCNHCSESSSIGKNSDLSQNSMEKLSDGEEVQSSYKGPLDSMEALEEVLPIRGGISRFYRGKSKSFTSLTDASSSSSMKDLAKPENAYMRRRRYVRSPLKSNGGGISKRLNRATLALAVAMSSSKRAESAGEDCLGLRPSFSLEKCVSVAADSDQLVTSH